MFNIFKNSKRINSKNRVKRGKWFIIYSLKLRKILIKVKIFENKV